MLVQKYISIIIIYGSFMKTLWRIIR